MNLAVDTSRTPAPPPAPAAPGPLRRVLGSVWFRAAVTLGLLALVASKIDWSALGRRVSDGEPLWLAVAVCLIVAALVLGALRWWQLLHAAGVRIRARELGRVYAVSTFASTFLPTSVGGDVARALLVTRDRALLVRVGLTVIVDRAGALAGLLILAWIGLAAEPDAAPSGAVALLVAVTVATIVGGIAVVWAAVHPRVIRGRLLARLRGPLGDVREILATYGRRPLIPFTLVVSSVAFQALVAAQLCAIARCLGIGLSFASAVVALTLVTLATLVPISIAGFGIREASYVVLLGGIGISATDATAISLTTVLVLFLASLPGAFLLARDGMRPVL